MPLTEQERQQCRRYTGRTRVNARLDCATENALDAVNALEVSDPPAGAQLLADVRAVLAELVALDARMAAGATRAGIRRAEDVEFFPGGALSEYRSAGRMWVQRLCTLLGVILGQDPFSGFMQGGEQRQG